MNKLFNGRIFLIIVILMLFSSSVPTYAAFYQYDDANRLTMVTYDNGVQVQYSYDKNGNMLSSKKIGVGNLLKNPSFELYTGSSGVANDWIRLGGEAVNSQFSVVNTPVLSGQKAQKINATGLATGKKTGIYQEIPVEPFQSYSLSGSLRIDSLVQAKASLYVEFYDKDGKNISGKLIEKTEVTNKYVVLEEQGLVPAQAVKGAVFAVLEGTGNNGSGTIYVDDLFFKTNPAGLHMLNTSPENEALEVDLQQPMTITFNKTITAGPDYSAITLKQGEAVVVTAIEIEQQVLTVTPVEALMKQSLYTLSVPKNAIQDSEGRGLSEDIVLSFITKDDSNPNLLQNGGFEQYTEDNGVGDYWRDRVSQEVQGSFEIVHDPVQSGTNAQKISASGLSDGKSISIYQSIDVIGTENFELSGFICVDALEQAATVLYVDFYNEAGAYVGGKFIEQSEVTNGYVTLQ
ncbi:Ig-like domain-containing protein [Paenibacillus motobuensis]|uniref:SbsA Ig-like domain-containing protein n=1 Tax=Paenibacillus motobuensis TaxID=295324 RepID=A0ABP3I8W0_9BACL